MGKAKRNSGDHGSEPVPHASLQRNAGLTPVASKSAPYKLVKRTVSYGQVMIVKGWKLSKREQLAG